MSIAPGHFAIVPLFSDRPDRLETATIVNVRETLESGFSEIEWYAWRMRKPDDLELTVVDSQRRRVSRGH